MTALDDWARKLGDTDLAVLLVACWHSLPFPEREAWRPVLMEAARRLDENAVDLCSHEQGNE